LQKITWDYHLIGSNLPGRPQGCAIPQIKLARAPDWRYSSRATARVRPYNIRMSLLPDLPVYCRGAPLRSPWLLIQYSQILDTLFCTIYTVLNKEQLVRYEELAVIGGEPKSVTFFFLKAQENISPIVHQA